MKTKCRGREDGRGRKKFNAANDNPLKRAKDCGGRRQEEEESEWQPEDEDE